MFVVTEANFHLARFIHDEKQAMVETASGMFLNQEILNEIKLDSIEEAFKISLIHFFIYLMLICCLSGQIIFSLALASVARFLPSCQL